VDAERQQQHASIGDRAAFDALAPEAGRAARFIKGGAGENTKKASGFRRWLECRM
jgi:hypothetical protein